MGLDIYFEKRANLGEVGYFRKVNFLVRFFEERGYEIGNLKPVCISLEDAEELKDRCEQVIANHDLAPELLPTTEGFYFGSTDYDEDYFESVDDVLDFCSEQLIPEFNDLTSNEEITFSIWF